MVSLGAGRPMWLGLPLFVFPTQPNMSRAISTWSHSQGPLRLKISPYLWFIAQKRAPCLCTAGHTWHYHHIYLFYKRRLRWLLRSSDLIFDFSSYISWLLFLATYVHVFAFVSVLEVFSAACVNNQIRYSHLKKKKKKQQYFDVVAMRTDAL